MKYLSIIIVNYNTTDLTLDCIRSIYAFAPACGFEILLIDNGSDDRAQQKVAGEFPEVRFIEAGKNTGYSSANNLGMQNARGEFFLLLNSDTKILNHGLNHMISYMRSHDGVGILGPRHVDGYGKFQLSCGQFPTLFSELVRKIWHYRLSVDDYQVRDYLDLKHASMSNVDWVSGSCMLIRREVLEQTGLLDEQFFMYFEDIDLCRRVWNNGFAVHYFPDTTILHYGGQSARLNLMRVYFEYRRSQIYFSRKYYGWPGQAVIRNLLFFKYAGQFLGRVFVYGFSKCFKKSTSKLYVQMMLAKKIVFLVFQPVGRQPAEPVLRSRHAAAQPYPIFAAEGTRA